MNNTTKQNEHIAPTTTKEDSTTLARPRPMFHKIQAHLVIWVYDQLKLYQIEEKSLKWNEKYKESWHDKKLNNKDFNKWNFWGGRVLYRCKSSNAILNSFKLLLK